MYSKAKSHTMLSCSSPLQCTCIKQLERTIYTSSYTLLYLYLLRFSLVTKMKLYDVILIQQCKKHSDRQREKYCGSFLFGSIIWFNANSMTHAFAITVIF